MKKGKVQTNEYGVNVLVEHEDCNGTHISHLDVNVLCEKLSNAQIDDEFSKLILTRGTKIDILKKIKGFAVSNVQSKQKSISVNDLFKYVKR